MVRRRASVLTPNVAKSQEELVVKEKKEPINLTQEVLESLWKEVAEAHREEEKLFALMQDRKLALKDQNNFDITFSNLYQEEELAAYKTQILGELRERSGHDFLQWRSLVERQQAEKVTYQPREKYEAMVKANPAMSKLKALFPEIDY